MFKVICRGEAYYLTEMDYRLMLKDFMTNGSPNLPRHGTKVVACVDITTWSPGDAARALDTHKNNRLSAYTS